MSRRVCWLVVLWGSVLSLTACGGSTMDLADYFGELQATSDAAEARYIALTEQASTRLAPLSFSPPGGWESDAARAGEQLLGELSDDARFTQEVLEIDVMIYGGLEDMLAMILSRIQEMDPPDEAIHAHTEMVAAAVEWAELVDDLTSALTNVASAPELTERLAPLSLDSRFGAIGARFESACLALQAVADLDANATLEFSGPWLGGLDTENATADFACG